MTSFEYVPKPLILKSLNPVFTIVQLSPLFVERKTPVDDIAEISVSFDAAIIEETYVLGNPELTADQFEPLSVERKTPAEQVTYIYEFGAIVKL